MKAIWKYPLEVTDVQEITMPVESEILSVHFQHGQLTLWTQVETGRPTTELRTRTIYIFGTGITRGRQTPRSCSSSERRSIQTCHSCGTSTRSEEYSNGR